MSKHAPDRGRYAASEEALSDAEDRAVEDEPEDRRRPVDAHPGETEPLDDLG